MQATQHEKRARIRGEASRLKDSIENLSVDARNAFLAAVETGVRWTRRAVDEISAEIDRARSYTGASRPAR